MTLHFVPHRSFRTALCFSLALAPCACRKKDAAAGDAAIPAVVGAHTAIATRRSVRETIDGIGTIAARPDHIAQMSAPAVTRVTKVYVTVGERVRAGAPLIAFDRAPLDAQNAAAATALASAQRTVERARRLVDAGIAPRKDLDQAESELARANADAVTAARLHAQATLHAPIAGVVTRMSAVLGATVDPAQTLVEVTDPTALDLLIPVPPTSAARVHRGAIVDMTAQPGAASEALGDATVADVGATIDSVARAVVVRAPITKPARQLRIGETVFARIVLAAHANAVTVPAEAIVPEGEGLKVFVVDAAHEAHATPVTVGVRDGDLAEITSGLSGGETVVTYGAFGVTDSAKVMSPSESSPATTIPVGTSKP